MNEEDKLAWIDEENKFHAALLQGALGSNSLTTL